MRDLNYEILSNSISEKAMSSDPNFIPPKIKSDVTPEMIEDYQAKQQQRIAGTFKYKPVDFALDVPEFVPVRSEADLDALRLQKVLKTRLFRKAEAEFTRIQDEKEAVRNQFDIAIGVIEKSKIGKMSGKKPILKILENETKLRNKYAADMLALDTREEAERLKLTQADADIATIDYNGRQIDGDVENVLSLGNLKSKFEAFGWTVFENENGNDIEQVIATLTLGKSFLGKGKPIVIIMKTEMGMGVDYMMGTHKWHGSAPNDEQLESALAQLPSSLKDY
jgi:hypothetical protein